MYTRVFNKMTAEDIQAYLDRGGNTLFIGVGVVEVHGAMPVDVEQLVPEGMALAMAEKADGLAVTNLPYYFPGGTIISPATVQVSVRESIDHLMMLCRSFIAQGFRKIFFVTAHGPARLYVDAVCRDIFQETKIHVCHLNGMSLMQNFGNAAHMSFDDLDTMGCGAYKMMHQMEFLKIDPEAKDPEPMVREDTPVSRFTEAIRPYGSPVSIIFGSPKEHGGGRAFRSEAERLERCERGERMIREMVDRMDLEGLKNALDEYQAYVNECMKKVPRIRGLY
ncbi:MAG: creatininase family protein [Clostridia bacterium]|nr:creatininase family protein [Clostridia bacterium]